MPIDSNNAFVAEGGYQYDFFAIPGSKPPPIYGYATQTWGDNPRFQIGGSFHGFYYGVVGSGGYAWNEGNKPGPDANQYSSYAGVLGTGIYVTGVAGTSLYNVGVYGQQGEVADSSLPQNLSAGVIGVSDSDIGVYGEAGAQFVSESWIRKDLGGGVVGVSYVNPGVMGWGAENPGIVGFSSYDIGVFGGSANTNPAVFGFSYYGMSSGVCGQTIDEGPAPGPNLPTNAGVYGSSNALPGVTGTSKASAGVFGFSNGIGVYGVTTNAASYAGFFQGNVKVTGTLTAQVKHAVVPFPDGTQRLLHCMESPEHWFEDFGAARLKKGRAVVKIDADFVKVIKRGDYRVFVTPEGDCRGLYVRRKNAKRFEVRELTDGKSSIAFCYRIIGRRKDIRGHRRFAKIDMRAPLRAPTSTTRKAATRAVEPRVVISRMKKEMQRRRAKAAPESRRSRTLPKGPRPSIRPQLQLPQVAKK